MLMTANAWHRAYSYVGIPESRLHHLKIRAVLATASVSLSEFPEDHKLLESGTNRLILCIHFDMILNT